MADFLTTKDSLSKIDQVIRKAEEALTILTPYVQISDDFERKLRDANSHGVEIRLVCRGNDLKPSQREALSRYENLTVYDAPKLHAKCFVNESGAVITSLNFYEASEQNLEMGVYLDASEDPEAYREAVREANSIVESSKELVGTPKKRHRGRHTNSTPEGASEKSGRFRFLSKKSPRATHKKGHCIRCGTSTDYDPSKPYCAGCFKQWARFKNPTYADDRCHGCGKEEAKRFSLEKPECYSCYKRHAKGGVTA